jgi:hypothetical protein
MALTGANAIFNGPDAKGYLVVSGNIMYGMSTGIKFFDRAGTGNIVSANLNAITDFSDLGASGTVVFTDTASTDNVSINCGKIQAATLTNIDSATTVSVRSSILSGTQAQSGTGRADVSNSQHASRKTVSFKLAGDDAIATTGDGKVYYTWPDSGTWELVSANASVYSAGDAGGSAFDVDIQNITDGTDVLSTNITIDAGETSSLTAVTQPVINASNNAVVRGEQLRFDIDTVTADSEGCELFLTFRYKQP